MADARRAQYKSTTLDGTYTLSCVIARIDGTLLALRPKLGRTLCSKGESAQDTSGRTVDKRMSRNRKCKKKKQVSECE